VCSSCEAPIVWAMHASTGNTSPFDAEPAELGLWELSRTSDYDVIARYVGPRASSADPLFADPATLPGRYSPHFATCPNAKQHRR
jgi:hypothetical protein